MLNWLNEYIKTTPLSDIKKEWEEIEEKFPVGVNAFEYLEYSKEAYKICYKPPIDYGTEKLIAKNMTSNFSGSFFLLNLHNETRKESRF